MSRRPRQRSLRDDRHHTRAAFHHRHCHPLCPFYFRHHDFVFWGECAGCNDPYLRLCGHCLEAKRIFACKRCTEARC